MFQHQQLVHVSSINTVVIVVVVRRRPQQGKGSMRHGTGCGCRGDRRCYAEPATDSEQSRGVILATSRATEHPEWCQDRSDGLTVMPKSDENYRRVQWSVHPA